MARILIVDDDPDLLAIMHQVLSEASHNVISIMDSRTVIEGAAGIEFDLVITDMIMPGVDGLEMLSYLHRLNPKIKAIAISGGGYFRPEFHLNLASKFGAILTLEKPFQPSWLVALVHRVLYHNPGQPGPVTSFSKRHPANDDYFDSEETLRRNTPSRDGEPPDENHRSMPRIFTGDDTFSPLAG